MYAYVGEKITLPSATKDGYTFKGWSDGTNTYAAGANYTVEGNVTLTAQWEAIQYTITLTNNGWSSPTVNGVANNQKAYAGDKITFTVTNGSGIFASEKTITVKAADGTELYTGKVSKGATVNVEFTMPVGNVTITIS